MGTELGRKLVDTDIHFDAVLQTFNDILYRIVDVSFICLDGAVGT